MKQVLRYRFVRRVSVPHKQARTCNEASSNKHHQPRAQEPSISKQEPVMKQQASPTKDTRTKHQQAGTCNAASSNKQQQALRYRFVRRVSVPNISKKDNLLKINFLTKMTKSVFILKISKLDWKIKKHSEEC